MFNIKSNNILGIVILLWCIIPLETKQNIGTTLHASKLHDQTTRLIDHHDTIKVPRDIIVSDYFQFMDSVIFRYDSLTSYPLTEHLLVRNNSWIIDSLKRTDYYFNMSRDSFIYDQKRMIILPKASQLVIPDQVKAQSLLRTFDATLIDINIPEYKLRIWNDTIINYEFTVRVGRNEKKFLAMSGRVQDLRTKTGEGTIVAYNRFPRYINPVNNYEYHVTRRDDGKLTTLPQIPFIETELNGWRYGQLIHPTTNPETLGKAYSNGCIGTSEGDAWVIYYHAPIGTKINIRYDLDIINMDGDSIRLEDVYKLKY